MNAGFAGFQGSVGAALTLVPGIGFALNGLWQGISSIGKVLLQHSGIW